MPRNGQAGTRDDVVARYKGVTTVNSKRLKLAEEAAKLTDNWVKSYGDLNARLVGKRLGEGARHQASAEDQEPARNIGRLSIRLRPRKSSGPFSCPIRLSRQRPTLTYAMPAFCMSSGRNTFLRSTTTGAFRSRFSLAGSMARNMSHSVTSTTASAPFRQ